MPGTFVLLATGGTIAGTALSADDELGYRAAQLSGADVLAQVRAAVPALAGLAIEVEEVAQIDSKDMSHALWQALAQAAHRHLARPEVQGVVITHGTDTLEETAYFLQRVLAPGKPLVMTAAMRPATSRHADGPANLRDAFTVAGTAQARGVVAVLAGQVWSGLALRKQHTQAVDAFGDGGIGGLVATVSHGVVQRVSAWPAGKPLGLAIIARPAAQWPVVELITSHAGARGEAVDALVAAGAHGLVVAGTGNGTVHAALEARLHSAVAAGVQVLRASRCASGPVEDAATGVPGAALPSAGSLSAVQARVELLLRLLSAQR